jgi:hypothetical protein
MVCAYFSPCACGIGVGREDTCCGEVWLARPTPDHRPLHHQSTGGADVDFFAVWTTVTLAAWTQAPLDRNGMIFLVLGPPLTAMFIYAAAHLFLTHIRFNDDGIERRFLRQKVFVAWTDIFRIRRHFFFGPQIVAKDGRKVVVWEYWRGFRELMNVAAVKGIPIDFGAN